ncbi:hypothetical protein RRG08_043407 [Elysia crispata]|uniref:Uncharacterized protein n=1 Tax=Elysia crispata TaxID=231223 RepID=A0AAE1AU15_9GAST|nr:hypothetical protein RRG08_043407 [Elysia crispata]
MPPLCLPEVAGLFLDVHPSCEEWFSLRSTGSREAAQCVAVNAAAPSPLNQMPPQDGMPGGPMPPSFFPRCRISELQMPSFSGNLNVQYYRDMADHGIPALTSSPPASQPSPHPPPHNPMMGGNQPFMSPRYPGGPRVPVRMQNQVEFNGPPGPGGGQMPMQNSMDPRPGALAEPLKIKTCDSGTGES